MSAPTNYVFPSGHNLAYYQFESAMSELDSAIKKASGSGASSKFQSTMSALCKARNEFEKAVAYRVYFKEDYYFLMGPAYFIQKKAEFDKQVDEAEERYKSAMGILVGVYADNLKEWHAEYATTKELVDKVDAELYTACINEKACMHKKQAEKVSNQANGRLDAMDAVASIIACVRPTN